MFIEVIRLAIIVGGLTSPMDRAAPPDPPSLGLDPARRTACAGLPGNLTVEMSLRALVNDMWQRAPIFRRQLARLAREPSLVLTIRIWTLNLSPSVRARTHLSRVSGDLRAAVLDIQRLDPLSVVELVAHEIEHVLEQLDGVDLARRSGRNGIRRGREGAAHESFETERARQVGVSVAREYVAATAIATPCGELP
jgi:hypothetical protein